MCLEAALDAIHRIIRIPLRRRKQLTDLIFALWYRLQRAWLELDGLSDGEFVHANPVSQAKRSCALRAGGRLLCEAPHLKAVGRDCLLNGLARNAVRRHGL
jgi:hypothetical protein